MYLACQGGFSPCLTVLVIDGSVSEVTKSSGGGVCVEPGNHELLAKTILDLSKDPRRDKLAETLQLLERLVES